MSRDEFSPKVKSTLALRVGGRCSNPTCPSPHTSGPQEDPEKATNLGDAADITAASPEGPRYDKNLTPAQRKSIENAIWLCKKCAKLIDNDSQRYTVDVLKSWKSAAEEAARRELESGSLRPPATDLRRVPCELPPSAEQFFGREAELNQLTERLRAGKNSAVVGPAGLGKTALAAEAVRAAVGDTPESLAVSPFPDGVVFLDLYTFKGEPETTWNTLANTLGGPEFLTASPARDRATEACRARRVLIILEGAEEVEKQDNHDQKHRDG